MEIEVIGSESRTVDWVAAAERLRRGQHKRALLFLVLASSLAYFRIAVNHNSPWILVALVPLCLVAYLVAFVSQYGPGWAVVRAERTSDQFSGRVAVYRAPGWDEGSKPEGYIGIVGPQGVKFVGPARLGTFGSEWSTIQRVQIARRGITRRSKWIRFSANKDRPLDEILISAKNAFVRSLENLGNEH